LQGRHPQLRGAGTPQESARHGRAQGCGREAGRTRAQTDASARRYRLMRAWAIVATVVAAGTLAAGGTLAAMLLRGGISARSEPSSFEASRAFKARQLALRGS